MPICSSCLVRRTVEPGVKPPDIYPFKSSRDVERVARSARVWVDRYALDKEAVTRAEEVIKVGQRSQGGHGNIGRLSAEGGCIAHQNPQVAIHPFGSTDAVHVRPAQSPQTEGSETMTYMSKVSSSC